MALKDLYTQLLQKQQTKSILEQMFNSMNDNGQMAFMDRPGIKAQWMKNLGEEAGEANNYSDEMSFIDSLRRGGASSTLKDGTKINTVGDELSKLMTANGSGNPGDLGALALGAAKAHPFKTAGLVGLGAGNIGGLMDNNKFGGQLGGLALGGLGSYLMGASPYTAAMMTMGGGELGALFDKLRAKKEQPNQQPYYGGR